ncbi:MAG: threonine ammonia-lyase [Mogibacterium sp.]|nr:threonine ammonia-lyase [Mogibacterium sp.]
MAKDKKLSLDRIYQAAYVLKDVARKTDLIYSPHFSKKNQVYLKTENLQATGSFKLRGAYFKISQLSEEDRAAGIVACSAGNHAQGVALAAERMGIKSTICMPDGAPISKVEATKSYGAEVCLVKGAYDDAYAYACRLQEENHATFIHPFNDPDVIAGQGTIGLEILDQLSEVDAIVVPVGGGGLVSGVAYAVKHLNPSIKVYGVQASEAASMADSLKYDEQVTLNTVNTFADGIAVKQPGDLTFSLIKKYVDEVVTVSEDEIAAAILALIEKQKLIAEGAGAVSVAAVMFDKIPVEGRNVVCLVSGGNIDVNILSRVITRGLVTSGRNSTLQIALEDKPGQLVDVATIIASCGANVTGVHYGHSDANTAVTSCVLTLDIETRDFGQIEEIHKVLTEKGFKLL